jgi:hypothetical protein
VIRAIGSRLQTAMHLSGGGGGGLAGGVSLLGDFDSSPAAPAQSMAATAALASMQVCVEMVEEDSMLMCVCRCVLRCLRRRLRWLRWLRRLLASVC